MPPVAIDRARWEQLAARMRTRWPDQLSNIKSEAYYAALSDLSKDELEKGVDALVASDTDDLPSPDQLRAAASGEATAPAGQPQAAGEPEERKIAGIPASWLLSGVVAVVVAAVIVVVFVVVFDDDGSSDAAPPPLFETTAVENELVQFDWGEDRTAAVAKCEQAEAGVIACEVVFENDEDIEVSVTRDENGNLTVDVPEGEGTDGEGGGGQDDAAPSDGSDQRTPSPDSP